jgi:hypothetical protein
VEKSQSGGLKKSVGKAGQHCQILAEKFKKKEKSFSVQQSGVAKPGLQKKNR